MARVPSRFGGESPKQIERLTEGTMDKETRYLRQVVVVRKDLSMPTGKLAAIVAHASMSFLVKRLSEQPHLRIRKEDRLVEDTGVSSVDNMLYILAGWFTEDEHRWFTELDPGLEDIGQVSFAKIVVAVNSLAELEAVEQAAKDAELTCHRVTDSGYSHNKAGDVAAIAIGPAWPEQLEPVTGALKVYR